MDGDRRGGANLITALSLGFGISWGIPGPNMMSSLPVECRLVTPMMVLARSEYSDIS